MSWGAFGLAVDVAKITAPSDFWKTNLQTTAFGAGGPAYVNIDAGLSTDPKPLVDHLHSKGQRAGTYRVPFSYFHSASDPNPLAATVGGTSSRYADIVLRDDANNPIQYNGAYVLDVTHPDTRAMMKSQMDPVVAGGFDWLKLDFMTNGAMEGHHHDPAVKTWLQAYNQAIAVPDEPAAREGVRQPVDRADLSRRLRPFAPQLVRRPRPTERSAATRICPLRVDRIHAQFAVDGDSGIGEELEIAHVDGDGKRDLVVSNKKGLFVFRRR